MYRYVDMLCFPQETFCYVPTLSYVRNFKVRYFGLNAILYELKTTDATRVVFLFAGTKAQ